MHLGVTGSREGPLPDQRHRGRAWLIERRNVVQSMHHGCCEGVDAWAMLPLFGFCSLIIAHPPIEETHVDDWAIAASDVVLPAAPYMERNHAIVAACDRLLAFPKGPEELRSGTWATIRFARKIKRRITIIWPDGKITEENEKCESTPT